MWVKLKGEKSQHQPQCSVGRMNVRAETGDRVVERNGDLSKAAKASAKRNPTQFISDWETHLDGLGDQVLDLTEHRQVVLRLGVLRVRNVYGARDPTSVNRERR